MNKRALAHDVAAQYRDEVLRVVQDLIRIPSQNMPPVGEEGVCQEYVAHYLKRAGLPADVYEPDTAPGLLEHPAYWPGRSYRGRPNVSSLMEGRGSGRSLLLTGHMDTVALGDNVWSRPPFGSEIHDGRMYGLGTIDMKGAMGTMLVLFKAIAEQHVPLRGALSFESVVDEEEGGVNATIAGRLRAGPMDGAVIPEGTGMQVYPAARGALITDFIFSNGQGTWLEVGTGKAGADAVQQIGVFLTHIPELIEARRNHPDHPLYREYPDPVPVQVTKVYAGGWGSKVPIAVPPEGRIEVILQSMPGESFETVDGQLREWFDRLVAACPDVFNPRPQIHRRLRFLPGTAIEPGHPLVTTMVDSVAAVTGSTPKVLGAPYACDMFALHQIFGMPGLLLGPTGANAHAADEYVEVDSLFAFFEALLLFVMEWCGVAE